MQLNKYAFAVAFISMVGFVWSPGVVSALHHSTGDGGGGRHDGLEMENGIRVGNDSKKAERDDCIFGGRSFFGGGIRRYSLF